ncbi:hypothetical protein RI367_003234 [Sorochytrium milnesiophthora]
MSYSDDTFRQKLAKLTNMQDSIQMTSNWMQFHRRHSREIGAVWERELSKAPPPKKLSLLYLANDVLQNSRKKGPEFVTDFSKILPQAVVHAYRACPPDIQQRVVRLLSIWQERSVFTGAFTQKIRDELLAALNELPAMKEEMAQLEQLTTRENIMDSDAYLRELQAARRQLDQLLGRKMRLVKEVQQLMTSEMDALAACRKLSEAQDARIRQLQETADTDVGSRGRARDESDQDARTEGAAVTGSPAKRRRTNAGERSPSPVAPEYEVDEYAPDDQVHSGGDMEQQQQQQQQIQPVSNHKAASPARSDKIEPAKGMPPTLTPLDAAALTNLNAPAAALGHAAPAGMSFDAAAGPGAFMDPRFVTMQDPVAAAAAAATTGQSDAPPLPALPAAAPLPFPGVGASGAMAMGFLQTLAASTGSSSPFAAMLGNGGFAGGPILPTSLLTADKTTSSSINGSAGSNAALISSAAQATELLQSLAAVTGGGQQQQQQQQQQHHHSPIVHHHNQTVADAELKSIEDTYLQFD